MKRSIPILVFGLAGLLATVNAASADVVTYDIVRGGQDNFSYSYFATPPNSPSAGEILWWIDGTFSIDFLEDGTFEFVSMDMTLYPFESLDEVDPFAKNVAGAVAINTEEANDFNIVNPDRLQGSLNLLFDMAGGPLGTATIDFRPSSFNPLINSMTDDEIFMWGMSDLADLDAVNGLENIGVDGLFMHLGGVKVVPEPATLSLLLLSGAALLRRRR